MATKFDSRERREFSRRLTLLISDCEKRTGKTTRAQSLELCNKPDNLYRYRTGEMTPTFATICQIIRYYGVPFEWLIGWTVKPENLRARND